MWLLLVSGRQLATLGGCNGASVRVPETFLGVVTSGTVEELIGMHGGRMADASNTCRTETQVRLARAVVENLRPADLAAELAAGDVVLVDVRGPDELTQGMISGAISIPRGIVEFIASPASGQRARALDPVKRVVLYSGTGSRSALAANTLSSLGYRDVAHLDGGLAAWVTDGRGLIKRTDNEVRRRTGEQPERGYQ